MDKTQVFLVLSGIFLAVLAERSFLFPDISLSQNIRNSAMSHGQAQTTGDGSWSSSNSDSKSAGVSPENAGVASNFPQNYPFFFLGGSSSSSAASSSSTGFFGGSSSSAAAASASAGGSSASAAAASAGGSLGGSSSSSSSAASSSSSRNPYPFGSGINSYFLGYRNSEDSSDDGADEKTTIVFGTV